MLVVTGVFENERFIPDRPVSIPQKTKVVVTIEEETKNPARYFSQSEKDAISRSLFGVLPSTVDLDRTREERLS